MAYSFTFSNTDVDNAKAFDSMKQFRTWAQDNLGDGVVVQGVNVLSEDNTELGKLRYFKAAAVARPADVAGAPTMVQPGDGPSLDDVLADIDRLEAEDTPMDPDDAQLIEDMDGDGSDFEDEPVTAPKGTVGAAKRAGIPMLDEDVNSRQEGGWGSGPMPAPRPARRVSVNRRPRMNHKACGHAITGEAGKIARAECRARHRAAEEELILQHNEANAS